MFKLPLNSHNLPYPDTLHPIIVHFVIAMVLFSVFCDVLGFLTRHHRLFTVSFWNLVVASVSIFIAIIFGQLEASLAEPYQAVKPVLHLHTIIGWSLSAIVVGIMAWRGVLYYHNPLKVSCAYLGTGLLVTCLVFYQVFLGDQLAWVYGLHTVPVVEATKGGLLQ